MHAAPSGHLPATSDTCLMFLNEEFFILSLCTFHSSFLYSLPWTQHHLALLQQREQYCPIILFFFKLYFLERVRGEREIDLPSAGGQLGLI